MSDRENRPELLLSVADTGIGIPEDAAERVLEPYVRFESIHASGTGLGLTIVRNLLISSTALSACSPLLGWAQRLCSHSGDSARCRQGGSACWARRFFVPQLADTCILIAEETDQC